MNTNNKTNKGGAKEVATPKNDKTTVNGKANTNAKGTTTPKAEENKEEPKTPPVVAPKVEQQQRSLDEQINYYLGLERLVNIVRRFEKHLEAVQAIEVQEEELTQFETGNNYGVRIELCDSSRREYCITNPRLVKEMQDYLEQLLQNKIDEYNTQILNYDQIAAANQ